MGESTGSVGTGRGGRVTGWMRGTFSRAAASLRERLDRPSVRVPRSAPPARVPRSEFGARLAARDAVRAGVRLDDFLRDRLASYAAVLPVSLHHLPASIEIAGGEPLFTARPATTRSAAATSVGESRPRWLRTLAEREGPHAAAAVRDAEEQISELDGRVETARGRVEALVRGLEADVASGAVVTPPRIVATPEQLGRPEVPDPLPAHALQGFAGLLALAQTWRLAQPALAALGVEGDLAHAAAGSPIVAGVAVAFAAGMTVTAVALALTALRRAERALGGGSSRRDGLAAVLGAVAAVGLTVAVAVPGPWTAAVFAAAAPFAAAFSLDVAGRQLGGRAGALAAQLAWDRQRAIEAAAYGRRLEAIARAREDLAALEEEREGIATRLAALVRRGVALDEAVARAARLDAERLERLAEALASALERDRFLFLRYGARVLLGPARAPIRLEPPLAQPVGVAG